MRLDLLYGVSNINVDYVSSLENKEFKNDYYKCLAIKDYFGKKVK